MAESLSGGATSDRLATVSPSLRLPDRALPLELGPARLSLGWLRSPRILRSGGWGVTERSSGASTGDNSEGREREMPRKGTLMVGAILDAGGWLLK